MRRVAVIALAAVLTGLIVGVVIAGSDDGSPGRPVSVPDPTIPDSSGTTDQLGNDKGTTDTPGTGGSQEQPQVPESQSGGAQPPAEDSPRNDVPPPPGSPAERFENEFCAQNPGACR